MYKLEMHLHTLRQSPCAATDEKTIAALYAKNGYNGIVCTNHYVSYLCENYYKQDSPEANAAYYLQGYRTLKKECEPYGIDVFLGMELLIDELTYYKDNPPKAELLIYGLEEEWLLSHPYDLFSMNVAEVSALCKEKGWLLGQSHPYRTGIDQQDPALLDCCEVFNGLPGQTNRNPLALKLAEENGLIFTAGSDFHHPDAVGCGVYLQRPVKTNRELVAELKKREHIVFKRPGCTD